MYVYSRNDSILFDFLNEYADLDEDRNGFKFYPQKGLGLLIKM